MIEIHLLNDRQSEWFSHEEGLLEIGRLPSHAVATQIRLLDQYVGREQMLVELLPDDHLRLTNVNKQVPIYLQSPWEQSILPGQSCETGLPLELKVGMTQINIGVAQESSVTAESFHTIMRPQLDEFEPILKSTSKVNAKSLLHWFERLTSVQQAAAGTDAFYNEAASATVELIGLNRGYVLLLDEGSWHVKAKCGTEEKDEGYSQTVLNRMLKQEQTLYFVDAMDSAESLINAQAVIASPILDAQGKRVIGAIYGVRTTNLIALTDLGELEAQFVQVLAAAVSAGLARQQQESEATRRRLQFEQFVSAEFAQELDRDPTLLNGRDREITVLFADIRSFSRLSEQMGAQLVCELVRSVMDRLNQCVRRYQGTTVSYLGDGFLAMWNAPIEQPGHAALATQAALDMIAELPEINAVWESRLGGTVAIGIGINTGPAMVGNTGSAAKPHYGPLGHTVNLASRIEGATKQLGVPLLVSGSTHAQWEAESFESRRLCQLQLVGVHEPVVVFEPHTASSGAHWLTLRDAYMEASAHYESGQWSQAVQILTRQLHTVTAESDLPSLILLQRSIDCLRDPPAPFDPVWKLASK